MTRIVKYYFGKVACQTMGRVSEGCVKRDEDILAAFRMLRTARSFKGTTWYDSQCCCSTEEVADKAIQYLQENHPDALRFSGDRPSHAAHGRVLFDKMAELELTANEEKAVDSGLAELVFRRPHKEYQ